MAKRIIHIHSTVIGKIRVNDNLGIMSQDGLVSEIEFLEGSMEAQEYTFYTKVSKESYVVHFEKSKRTLEVFDVNYVIRDEE